MIAIIIALFCLRFGTIEAQDSEHAQVIKTIDDLARGHIALPTIVKENLFFSPGNALMLYGFASKFASTEDRDSLGKLFAIDGKFREKLSEKFFQVLSKGGGFRKLKEKIGNFIIFDDSFKLDPALEKYAKDEILADIRQGDLQTNQFIGKVNDVIDNRTQGMIPTLLPGKFSDSVKVVFVNTFTGFSSKFMQPCRQIFLSYFLNIDGSTSTRGINYLTCYQLPIEYAKLPWIKNRTIEVVSTDLEENFQIVFLIPESMEGLSKSDVLEYYFQIPGKLNRTVAHFSLPEFEIRPEMDISISNKDISIIGLKGEYIQSIKGLTKNLGPREVINFRHKSLFKISEMGIEIGAKAETKSKAADSLTNNTISDGKPIRMTLNRPFGFVIREKIEKMIYFVGFFGVPY